MKKTIAAGIIGLLVAGGAWAADTKDFDAAYKELISALTDGAEVLKDVRDEDSARAAKPKLVKIGQRLAALDKKLKQLGKPTEDQDKELKRTHAKAMKEAQTAFRTEMDRVAKVPGGKAALKELEHKR
jgi:hypothetical protein